MVLPRFNAESSLYVGRLRYQTGPARSNSTRTPALNQTAVIGGCKDRGERCSWAMECCSYRCYNGYCE
jgi:hypothetical protein